MNQELFYIIPVILSVIAVILSIISLISSLKEEEEIKKHSQYTRRKEDKE
jgi:predicted small secreted protein